MATTKRTPRTKESADEAGPGGERVTTAIVVRQHTLSVYQRVAALRGAQGRTEKSEAGSERPYSVSALIREALEARLPELEAELRRAGIVIPPPAIPEQSSQ